LLKQEKDSLSTVLPTAFSTRVSRQDKFSVFSKHPGVDSDALTEGAAKVAAASRSVSPPTRTRSYPSCPPTTLENIGTRTESYLFASSELQRGSAVTAFKQTCLSMGSDPTTTKLLQRTITKERFSIPFSPDSLSHPAGGFNTLGSCLMIHVASNLFFGKYSYLLSLFGCLVSIVCLFSQSF